MHSVEWSLVIFTLLSQFSVGILISMMIYQFLVYRNTEIPAGTLMRWGLYSALAIKAVALLVSFLHLSSPLKSVFALSNLTYSWLSREILMASVYAFLVFLATVYIHYPRRKNSVMVLLMGLSAISGLYLIYAMARLYMIPTVPIWDTPFTILGFTSSIFMTSPVLIIILSLRMYKSGPAIPSLQKFVFYLSIMAFSGLLLRLVGNLIFRPAIPVDVNIGFAMQETSFWIQALYWVLLALGAVFLARNTNMILKNKIPAAQQFYIVLVCFVCAEIIARAIFYYSYYRIGL